MTVQDNALRVGQRVQVVNLDESGQPAAFHGTACRIIGWTKDEAGTPAARVMFSGGIQKKILLSKLQPIEKPAPVAIERMNSTRPLPEWALGGCEWTLGSDLQAGDTVYLSSIANPRVLVESIAPGLWKSTVVAEYRGFVKRIPGQVVEVEAPRWYVVKRKVVTL